MALCVPTYLFHVVPLGTFVRNAALNAAEKSLSDTVLLFENADATPYADRKLDALMTGAQRSSELVVPAGEVTFAYM